MPPDYEKLNRMGEFDFRRLSVGGTTAVMGRPKNPGSGQPHKRKYVELRRPFHPSVKVLADRWGTDETEVVNRLVREGLEREGLWPPAQQKRKTELH